MKEGRYRLAEAILLSVFFLSVLYGVLNETNLGVIGNFFKVSAAVVTASGVVAYNLRNRVVDFSKYLIDEISLARWQAESIRRAREEASTTQAALLQGELPLVW